MIYLSEFCTETISSDKGSIDIFQTHLSYLILSRKWVNIHLKTVLVGICKWSKTVPIQLSLFPNAGMVRMEISCLYVFKEIQ